ncbi:helix-turn-helix domain-containing protein [Trichococcus sp.]|uniref:helix-turn-helix domain-containing protein n=1 Tax=Trichococcus sp. TaxID=1985464 RepID=UPI003C7DBC54
MGKEHLTSEQYTELKPFKDEKSRYDAPFGKQSLEMQHFMAALDVSREELMKDYAIDELQLKEFLFGTPEKSAEGKFFYIYYDLKNKVEEQKESSNKKALIKLLNSGRAFEKKIFYKLFRTVLGITQKEFSEIVNMNISTIRSWEQGKSTASGSSQMLIYMALPDEVKKELEVNKKAENCRPSAEVRAFEGTIRSPRGKAIVRIKGGRKINRSKSNTIQNLEKVSEIVKELN